MVWTKIKEKLFFFYKSNPMIHYIFVEPYMLYSHLWVSCNEHFILLFILLKINSTFFHLHLSIIWCFIDSFVLFEVYLISVIMYCFLRLHLLFSFIYLLQFYNLFLISATKSLSIIFIWSCNFIEFYALIYSVLTIDAFASYMNSNPGSTILSLSIVDTLCIYLMRT